MKKIIWNEWSKDVFLRAEKEKNQFFLISMVSGVIGAMLLIILLILTMRL